MLVLESIPFRRLDELNECLEHLRDCFDPFDNDAETMDAISEWKMAHVSVRNRDPETPADYAEVVFGVQERRLGFVVLNSVFQNCSSMQRRREPFL